MTDLSPAAQAVLDDAMEICPAPADEDVSIIRRALEELPE